MPKLVKAATWIRRHFEPGSEPAIDKLQDWALRESKGEVVAGSLYLYDDALTDKPAEPDADFLLEA